VNVLKSIFDFYIKSSIHVALAAVAFAAITMREFGIARDDLLLIFIFLGTITGYNFVKYAGIAKLHHLTLTKNLRAIQIFSFFCFVALVYVLFQQPLPVIVVSGILGILTALYALPVFWQKQNLRSINGMKASVIAFVWAGVTVVLPVLHTSVLSYTHILIEFIQRFLFVIVLILPFDIRDLRYDIAGLGTIPQQIGVKRSRILGAVLLVVVILLELLEIPIQPQAVVLMVIICTITALLVRMSVLHQSQYYASFWVEGVPIFWWLLLMAAGKIG